MGNYILNFGVYTMAMCGLIFFALFVYKKFSSGNFGIRNSNFLSIEDTLSFAPRKMLYVIRAGKERFLVASDADKTSLIAKLEDSNNIPNNNSSPNFDTELLAAANTVYRPSNLDKKVANINQAAPRQQFAHEAFTNEATTDNSLSGVDDLPEIKSFPKNNKKPNNVLKSMVNKIK